MILNGKPGDARGFVHKKIFGGIKGAVGGVVGSIVRGSIPTPASIVRGGVSGFFGRPAPSVIRRPPLPTFHGGIPPALAGVKVAITCGPGSRPDPILGITCIPFPGDPRLGGRQLPGGTIIGGQITPGPCDPGQIFRDGFCQTIGSPAGGVGEAVMGRFGAALEPMFVTQNVMRCLPGMVLGKAGPGGIPLCYNKKQISNKERLWPKGRAPLLTGGDMRCIAKAAAAANKLKRTQKRLEDIGLLKKPTRSKQKALPRGRSVIVESGAGSVVA